MLLGRTAIRIAARLLSSSQLGFRDQPVLYLLVRVNKRHSIRSVRITTPLVRTHTRLVLFCARMTSPSTVVMSPSPNRFPKSLIQVTKRYEIRAADACGCDDESMPTEERSSVCPSDRFTESKRKDRYKAFIVIRLCDILWCAWSFRMRVLVGTEEEIEKKRNRKHERNAVVRRNVSEVDQLNRDKDGTIGDVKREEVRARIVLQFTNGSTSFEQRRSYARRRRRQCFSGKGHRAAVAHRECRSSCRSARRLFGRNTLSSLHYAKFAGR